ncbi:MAG: BrnT family toxin [candidate division WS1 bacterium]|jgi:uncharacterized DUF497 family protein|nr:BrnT family toxin [candidate division WS1 bacterium]
MRFTDLEISEAVEMKLWNKHRVDLSEVDQVLHGHPRVRRGPENLYYIYGRTIAGRYLLVIMADLGAGHARLVTARDMSHSERRAYWEQ